MSHLPHAPSATTSQPWSFYSISSHISLPDLNPDLFDTYTPEHQVRVLLSLVGLKKLALSELGKAYEVLLERLMPRQEQSIHVHESKRHKEENILEEEKEAAIESDTTLKQMEDDTDAMDTSHYDIDLYDPWLGVTAQILMPYLQNHTLNPNLNTADFANQIMCILQEIDVSNPPNRPTEHAYLTERHEIYLDDDGGPIHDATAHCSFDDPNNDILSRPTQFLDKLIAEQDAASQPAQQRRVPQRSERIQKMKPSTLSTANRLPTPSSTPGATPSTTATGLTPISAHSSSIFSAEPPRRTTTPLPNRPPQKKRTTKLIDKRPTKKTKLMPQKTPTSKHTPKTSSTLVSNAPPQQQHIGSPVHQQMWPQVHSTSAVRHPSSLTTHSSSSLGSPTPNATIMQSPFNSLSGGTSSSVIFGGHNMSMPGAASYFAPQPISMPVTTHLSGAANNIRTEHESGNAKESGESINDMRDDR